MGYHGDHYQRNLKRMSETDPTPPRWPLDAALEIVVAFSQAVEQRFGSNSISGLLRDLSVVRLGQIICKHAPPESVLPQAQFIDPKAPPAKITIVGKEEADAAFNTVKLREYVESGRRSVTQCARHFGVSELAIELKVNVPDSYMKLDESTGMVRPCRRRGSKKE